MPRNKAILILILTLAIGLLLGACTSQAPAVEATEYSLIDIIPQTHQGEFKKSSHGWRESVNGFAILEHINKHAPVRQLNQYLLSAGRVNFPNTTGLFRGKGLDRQKREQCRLFFTAKYLQDLE